MTKEALTLLVHEMEYVLSCINEDKIPFDGDDFHEALRLGKEALAQPEQEPYCWTWDEWMSGGKWRAEYGWKKPERQVTNLQPLYTTPPQRKPLTDEEILEMWGLHDVHLGIVDFVRAIEAAHGIKE